MRWLTNGRENELGQTKSTSCKWALSSLCVSVSSPLYGQFLSLRILWTNGRSTLFQPSSYVMMIMSVKLDCWLPTVAVQRLRSLEENSFEIELEQERFWRTTSSGRLPRGLIRDYAWWVDGGSGAQRPNTHTHNPKSHMIACTHIRHFPLSCPRAFIHADT